MCVSNTEMFNQVFPSQFSALEAAVRYGYRPDDPHLLDLYLKMGAEQANGQSEAVERRLHLRLFNTLLDAICDSSVARHWRCLCLDNIYRPLRAMERLARSGEHKDQLRHLRFELSTLSHYFL